MLTTHKPSPLISLHHTSYKSSIDRSWSSFCKETIFPILYDLYDLYDLAHVAWWGPYYLRDLAHVSWVGSVLHRSCTTSHNGR